MLPRPLLLCIAFLVPLLSALASDVGGRRLEIDEVSLSGITLFTQSDLEKVLEIAPGDEIDQRKIVQTAKNIQELYRLHGYEDARVRTELQQKVHKGAGKPENILEIAIAEGKPTRVAKIRLEFDSPRWERELGSYVSRLGLRPGDNFDQEKLANGYRSVQDAISSYDFVGVKLSEVEVTPSTAPEVPLPDGVAKDTDRWVELTVRVTLGERVSFGFRGNKVFSASELTALVDEQRLLGFSKDYLERVKARIDDEYRRLGYEQLRIEMLTFENAELQERHVTLVINEGPRVQIAAIDFDGNSVFSSDRLREQFLDRAAPIIKRDYYYSKQVEKSAEALIDWMKSKGYLSAKLISVARRFNDRGDRVGLLIYLYEGEQTIVTKIAYPGREFFPDTVLNDLLGIGVGRPLDLFYFSDHLESVKTAYREHGFLDMKFLNEDTATVIRYSDENRSAEIELRVSEGTRYRISRVDIEGLTTTHENVARREVQLAAGDYASESLIQQSESRLRRLGIFGGVSVKAVSDPDRADAKILKVILEEGTPGVVATGIGLRNDLGGRVFGQAAYTNLWGQNHTVSLTTTANRRFRGFGADFCANGTKILENPGGGDHCFIEYDIELAYSWPWVFAGETTFRPRINVDRNQYSRFNASATSLTLALQRLIWKRPAITGVLSYSYERINQFDAADPIDKQSIHIGSVTPTLIMDQRNNPLLPTKGNYTTTSFEIARPEFLSQVNPFPVAYTRWQFRTDQYIPLPLDMNLFLSFRTGIEYNLSKAPPGVSDTDAKRYAIPLIKQFTLGGVGSLRGFSEQALNVQDIAVKGSLNYVNYRTQLDLPFSGPLRFVPFLDAANLLLDRYSFNSKLRIGVGAGFHYRSPVGPVNFDLGINAKPLPGEDTYRIHFSIGVI